MGVKKTTDFLEKATWTLAGLLLILCLGAAMTIDRGEAQGAKSQLENKLQETPNAPTTPAFSTEAPATDKDTAK
jgi:preprotein translocase subunit SecG